MRDVHLGISAKNRRRYAATDAINETNRFPNAPVHCAL
jgi:hypothetical protein